MDKGRINMQGAIIETACAIATESREQVIDMNTIPISQFSKNGMSRSIPFNIQLINCILERENNKLPGWSQFRITFDGKADDDMFGIDGSASGIALNITDAFGNRAIPGIPLPRHDIAPDSYRLNYTISLLRNKQPLKAGRYFSSVRFKMEYY